MGQNYFKTWKNKKYKKSLFTKLGTFGLKTVLQECTKRKDTIGYKLRKIKF
jgi:hypothetical protein